MRKTYQVLASIIPVLVVVQAASIAFATSSLFTWVQEGGARSQVTGTARCATALRLLAS